MSLRDTIENDYTIIDDLDSATLIKLGGQILAIQGVKVGPVLFPEMESASGVGVESTYASFSLPQSQLGPVMPADGDTLILSDQSRWRVLQARLATCRTRWLVTCTQMR